MVRQGKRVVVFGIFDGVHEGHRDFFRQAKEFEGELVVVVGRDNTALRLKNKKPKYSENERLKMVFQEKFIDKAVLGDEELSSYHIVEKLKPDIICLGYDQHALQQDLQKWMVANKKEISVVTLKPYKQEILHSSLLK